MKIKPKLYMLVGLPGSGKSTFREEYLNDADLIALSSDDYIERVAKSSGSTYNEMFESNIKEANIRFHTRKEDAIKLLKPIVIDRTNLTLKSRKSLLGSVGNKYEKICIYFPASLETITSRNKERNSIGRGISTNIINSMLLNFVEPSESEGFDKVLVVMQHEEYRKLIEISDDNN